MTHIEIVNKVKSILNEHGEVDAVSIADDRVLLKDYIESAIPDAVIMLAQKGYRVNVAQSSSKGNKTAAVPGFISLIYAKDSEWTKGITKVTEIGSPEYNIAMNSYTAPGKNSPMCYKDKEEVLTFLPSMTADGTVEYNVEYSNSGVNAEPKEATAVCYMTAALVLGMFGEDQGKQRLSDIATNMLQ